MRQIPRKESYGYWEWHVVLPRNKPLSKHGASFNNVMVAGLIVLTLPTIVLSCLVMFYLVRVTEWPKEYHGVGGAIMVLVNVLFYLSLNYLLYPAMGKIAYESEWIDEEEYRRLKQRRIPGSFVLSEPEATHEENEV